MQHAGLSVPLAISPLLRLSVSALAVLFLVSGCNAVDTISPLVDGPQLRPRADRYGCVPEQSPSNPVPPGDTTATASDGSCPVGFEVVPWW